MKVWSLALYTSIIDSLKPEYWYKQSRNFLSKNQMLYDIKQKDKNNIAYTYREQVL